MNLRTMLLSGESDGPLSSADGFWGVPSSACHVHIGPRPMSERRRAERFPRGSVCAHAAGGRLKRENTCVILDQVKRSRGMV